MERISVSCRDGCSWFSLLVLCPSAIEGQEPGTRKGCHYISLTKTGTWHPQGVPLHFTHQNKIDRAMVFLLLKRFCSHECITCEHGKRAPGHFDEGKEQAVQ